MGCRFSKIEFWIICFGSRINIIPTTKHTKSGKKKRKKWKNPVIVTVNATYAWAGGAPDVRFESKDDFMINAYDTLEYENCDDSGLQSLVDNLFPDQGPDLKAYKFVFKDGNHYVSSWTAVQVNNNIYIEVPEGDLPAGSRECFVALLEYSEESLGVNAVFLCVPKRRVDSAELLRTFMFIGFEVVHHSTCPTVPAVDEYILMAYSFD